jgi:hypothetical protein
MTCVIVILFHRIFKILIHKIRGILLCALCHTGLKEVSVIRRF